ncbi:MAG: hypothetical protein FWE06_06820 [Oscillospiraceae bacterium]|nr:hypothetical protein [Oscillospiraceae bacterium]
MRRIKGLAFVFALLLLISSIAACGLLPGGGSNEQDEALVGQWSWDTQVSWLYTFNADGTGTRGSAELETFTWHTRGGNRLVLNHGAGLQDTEWNYTIDGDSLNLTRRGGQLESFDYYRVGQSESLHGVWLWDTSHAYRVEFNADGTGARGFPDEIESFDWFTAGDSLAVDTGSGPHEHWRFVIDSDLLTIDSRQLAGLTYSYIRESAVLDNMEQDTALVGAWLWDADDAYRYEFNADGTGTRGFEGEIEDFEWFTMDGILVIDTAEQWEYSIDDDVLTIENVLVPGADFSYIRE